MSHGFDIDTDDDDAEIANNTIEMPDRPPEKVAEVELTGEEIRVLQSVLPESIAKEERARAHSSLPHARRDNRLKSVMRKLHEADPEEPSEE